MTAQRRPGSTGTSPTALTRARTRRGPRPAVLLGAGLCLVATLGACSRADGAVAGGPGSTAPGSFSSTTTGDTTSPAGTTSPASIPTRSVTGSATTSTPAGPTGTGAPSPAPSGQSLPAVSDVNLLAREDLATVGIDIAGVTRRISPESGGGTIAAAQAPISVCQGASLGALPGARGPALVARLANQEGLAGEVAVTLGSRQEAQAAYVDLVDDISACRTGVLPRSDSATVGPLTPIPLDEEFDKAAFVAIRDRSTGLTTHYGVTVVGARVGVVAYDGSPIDDRTVPTLVVLAAKRLSPATSGH